MKKNTLRFLMFLLVFLATRAQAQECCDDMPEFYAKVLSGVNFLQNTTIDGNKSLYKTGYIISGTLGLRYCYGLSLEGEYAFRRNAINKMHFIFGGSSRRGHIEVSSYMLNLLWDLPLISFGCAFWNIQPFIGAGIGYDVLKSHSSNSRIIFSQRWNRLSWQVMAALAYPLFCHTEVTLEYKFHQGGSRFYNHSLGVGLVYEFSFFE